MRLLLVEDNAKLAAYTKAALEKDGYAVDLAEDGERGLSMAKQGVYDALILDIMLPKLDGITLCRQLREQNYNLPIILLTALDEVEKKVAGLDSGADDYMTKPFSPLELAARIRALLRRPEAKLGETITVQDITLDLNARVAKRQDKELPLTLKEFVVLEYLMRHAGRTVTREQILEHCWDFAYDAFSNITDVYIKQLRKKLGHDKDQYIKTVRGVGYSFVE